MHDILHRMCWCLLISSQEKEKEEEEEEENSEEEEEENQRHSLFERVAASVRSLSFRWEVDYGNCVYTCFYSLNQSSLFLSFLFGIYCTNLFNYSIVEFWLWYLLLIRFMHVPVPVIDQQNHGSNLVLEPVWLKTLSNCFLNNLSYVCRQSRFQISNALFGRNVLQLIW